MDWRVVDSEEYFEGLVNDLLALPVEADNVDQLCAAVESYNYGDASDILEAGLNPNAESESGYRVMSALERAMVTGDHKITGMLFAFGADPRFNAFNGRVLDADASFSQGSLVWFNFERNAVGVENRLITFPGYEDIPTGSSFKGTVGLRKLLHGSAGTELGNIGIYAGDIELTSHVLDLSIQSWSIKRHVAIDRHRKASRKELVDLLLIGLRLSHSWNGLTDVWVQFVIPFIMQFGVPSSSASGSVAFGHNSCF